MTKYHFQPLSIDPRQLLSDKLPFPSKSMPVHILTSLFHRYPLAGDDKHPSYQTSLPIFKIALIQVDHNFGTHAHTIAHTNAHTHTQT